MSEVFKVIKDKLTPEGIKMKRFNKELAKHEVMIGYQHGDAIEKDGADVCDVAAWNEFGTVNSPSRPFLRDTVDKHQSQITANLQKLCMTAFDSGDVKTMYEQVGSMMKGMVQNEIVKGNFTPNAPATIKKKKSSHPLIDSSLMRQKVNYEVRNK